MKKFSLLLILVTITSVLFYFKINAQSLEGNKTNNVSSPEQKGAIGGRIINKKANRIESLETAGYVCPSFGQTIEIKKQVTRKGILKGPTSYFIPSFIKTTYPIEVNKAIIAYYSGTTNITCVHPSGATEIVTLSNIIRYGVSRNPIR